MADFPEPFRPLMKFTCLLTYHRITYKQQVRRTGIYTVSTPRSDDLYDMYDMYDLFPLQFMI